MHRSKIASWFSWISHCISPPVCNYCGILLRKRSIYCQECFKQVLAIVPHRLAITRRYALTVFSVSDYKDPIKKLVLAKQWSNIVASHQLGELIWDRTPIKYRQWDYLVPIPIHWLRRIKRGYNQAEEIARSIATYSDIPVATILQRNRYTAYQADCPYSRRGLNVEGAFSVSPSLLKYRNKHLLLVDDIMMTGSTLNAAAKTLTVLEPASLSAVVACRFLGA